MVHVGSEELFWCMFAGVGSKELFGCMLAMKSCICESAAMGSEELFWCMWVATVLVHM